MAVAVLVVRAFTLVQAAGTARVVRKRVRHPMVLRAGVGAIAAQSVWAGIRGWRRRSVRDHTLAWSDTAAQLVALLTESLSWGSRALPPDPRWSETFGVVVAAWLPFESLDGVAKRVSPLLWLATYAATTSDRSPWRSAGAVRGQRINEGLAQVVYAIVSETFARQTVSQAHELDTARADAVQQAERLAGERERQRQHRLIHDSSLQILETVAGGWEVDDELLLRRIEYETGRLRLMLGTAQEVQGVAQLGTALQELTDEFGLVGLAVDVRGNGLPFAGPIHVVEALRDATHEALMNVSKHAGVRCATVEAAFEGEGIRVEIHDDGAGFDTHASNVGFGVRQSIEARVRDAGGRATVTSEIGRGTRVELWMPQ